LIFREQPVDWRDLQNKVKVFFEEMGFRSEVAKTINGVRGHNEIDVYAESMDELNLRIFVECKFWNANIPQREINAFRTVIQDSGANIGYFIVKNGFQKGAFDSSENTNIKLMTFDELIDSHFYRWTESIFQRILDKLSVLKKYDSLIEKTGLCPGHILGFRSEKEWKQATNMIDKVSFLYFHIDALESKNPDKRNIDYIINSCPKFITFQNSQFRIDSIRDYIEFVMNSTYLEEICKELDSFIEDNGITLYFC